MTNPKFNRARAVAVAAALCALALTAAAGNVYRLPVNKLVVQMGGPGASGPGTPTPTPEPTPEPVTPPVLSFSSLSLTLSAHRPNSLATQTLQVHNDGTKPTLAFEALGSLPAGFSAVTNGCTGVLAAGASCDIVLSFSAAEPGGVTGQLLVGPSNGQVAVTLTGQMGTAPSCASIKQADPSAADGIYYVNRSGTVSPVMCDMTVDGGGWMLVFYGDSLSGKTIPVMNFYMMMTTGTAMKTYSESAATMPALPTNTPNAFTQFMSKGGTAAWKSKMGEWQIGAIPGTAVTSANLPREFSGVKTSNGLTRMWNRGAVWAGEANDPGNPFNLWDSNSAGSSICGGNGVGGPPNCPHFSGYWHNAHYDYLSKKSLYVR